MKNNQGREGGLKREAGLTNVLPLKRGTTVFFIGNFVKTHLWNSRLWVMLGETFQNIFPVLIYNINASVAVFTKALRRLNSGLKNAFNLSVLLL